MRRRRRRGKKRKAGIAERKTGREWQEVQQEGERQFERNAETRKGEGNEIRDSDTGREDSRRRRGQRGEQQVDCTSVTFCSFRRRMPRKKQGRRKRSRRRRQVRA